MRASPDAWLMDPEVDHAYTAILAVLIDPDMPDGEAVALLESHEGVHIEGDVRSVALVVLADRAVSGGDGEAAERLVGELERGDLSPTLRTMPEVRPWLRSRVLLLTHPDVVTAPLDYARMGWAAADEQLAVHDQAVRARIAAQLGLDQRDELERAARQDALTEIANRRAFDELQLPPDVDGAMLVVDVDEFKRVNDEHGHAVGDDVLREVARAIRQVCRGEDFVARLGGDEFVMVAREMHAEVLDERAALLVERVAATDWAAVSPGLAVTVSVGGAHGSGGKELLLPAADRALYVVKERGRGDWHTTTSGMVADGQGESTAARPSAS